MATNCTVKYSAHNTLLMALWRLPKVLLPEPGSFVPV